MISIVIIISSSRSSIIIIMIVSSSSSSSSSSRRSSSSRSSSSSSSSSSSNSSTIIVISIIIIIIINKTQCTYTVATTRALAEGISKAREPYGQFSKKHVCFCGLDPGSLKFETVRTNTQHICF